MGAMPIKKENERPHIYHLMSTHSRLRHNYKIQANLLVFPPEPYVPGLVHEGSRA
ncbi:hypothetical protein RSAG8_03288, partial [Rhizoctonia solani AG-8 WAC10335]